VDLFFIFYLLETKYLEKNTKAKITAHNQAAEKLELRRRL
jgi:hypothetical protein